MKPTLLDVVDEILKKLQEQPDAMASETGLRTLLVRRGYAKRDIEAAMKMVRPRIASIPHVLERGPGQIRHLSAYERFKLTPEARDALARLELYELLDPAEREAVLDRLDHFENEIGLEELDYLVGWSVCGGRDVEYQQTIYNVLEGKGNTLH